VTTEDPRGPRCAEIAGDISLGILMRPKKAAFVRAASALALFSGLILAGVNAAGAQAAKKKSAAAEMPRSATARCADSTWSKAATQQGACSNHGGVAKWIGKAPKGATARCKDGEYWTSADRQGACSGHDGVAYWMGKKSK
jgi:Protein of unknown function (DUF3761)